jgi:DMSO/TMAO reductase YedYZ heme-binding membrane subunit
MAKIIAILNTIAWAGFWVFGFLGLTTPSESANLLVLQVLLAAGGAAMGLAAWFWLTRHAEATGYAKARNRAVMSEDKPA